MGRLNYWSYPHNPFTTGMPQLILFQGTFDSSKYLDEKLQNLHWIHGIVGSFP